MGTKQQSMVAVLALGLASVWTWAPAAPAREAASAVESMSRPGPQEQALRKLEGHYELEMTMWPAPGAKPVITKGLVADRRMIGSYLQETMHPAPGSGMPEFQRIDYLQFDRVEGRWKYVSLDTRFPVSIMPATSFGPAGADGAIHLQFAPQGFVGFGPDVEGRFMLSDLVLSSPEDGLLNKEQHFNLATGDGKPWLFIRYAYRRK